jgi:hypothetical protein
VNPGDDCSQVPWDAMEPYVPAREPEPEPAGAAFADEPDVAIASGPSAAAESPTRR